MTFRPPAAVAFALDAIDTYGEPAGDSHCDHVLVPVSQQHLAQRNRCAPSTISWYLRRLGPAVVERRGGIVFDRQALAELRTESAQLSARTAVAERQWLDSFGRPTADGTQLLDESGAPATLEDLARQLGVNRSSAHRHVSALERAGRLRRDGRRLYALPSRTKEPPMDDEPQRPHPPGPLGAVSPEQVFHLLDKLTDLLGAVAEIAAQLLGSATTGAQDSRFLGAQTAVERGLRAGGAAARGRGFPPDVDLIDGIDVEITSNQSPTRAADSRSREDLRAEGSRIAEPDWTIGDLPGLLGPLLEECHRQELPGVTDAQRVADSLRPYTAAQIGAAARQMAADLRGGAPMRSPIAILVRKAEDGDPYYFRAQCQPDAPVPATRHTVVESDDPVDEEAMAAVQGLDEAALAELDQAVAAHLRFLLGERTSALESSEALTHWRPIVWRNRQQPREGA